MEIKSAKIILMILAGLPLPLPASGAIPAKITPAPITEPFELYFSDEPVVEATSHYPKALSRISENVTVITAAEIEAANVHTLDEILNRVAGMFVSFNGQDFGSVSTLHIDGSTSAHQHHTLVLLDGVKYNYSSSGTAVTNGIPVAIIERIEVVKGPASSAWGSALGGVINIITKDTGKRRRPDGKVFVSYGEARSSDIRGEAKGSAGKLGYYLYGGKQRSDGLRDNRFFTNENFYGKFRLNLAPQTELQFTAGYSQPEQKYFDYEAIDLGVSGASRDFFTTAIFNGGLSKNLNLTITANAFSRKLQQDYNVLGTGLYGPADAQFQDYEWQEDNLSFESRLVRSGETHTTALGLEYNRNELEQRIVNGPFPRGIGLPAEAVATPAREEQLAIYLNDTFTIARLTVIPGLRYDYHSIVENFLSPSLGFVYQFRADTLFRGSVARGFSAPFLGLIDGGGSMFTAVNPDLKPEQVWSGQTGVETAALKFCRLKTTVFFHKLRNSWERNAANEIVNTGRNDRFGYEIELETIPLQAFSLATNLTSIYENNKNGDNDHLYNFNIILSHDRPAWWRTELFGHYVWWQARESDNGHYNDFLWDLSIAKELRIRDRHAKIFLTGHNIFNSSQYWSNLLENPGRWFEAGISLPF
jgi:vitamin B12 transporter